MNKSLETALIELGVAAVKEIGPELMQLMVAYIRSQLSREPDESFLTVVRETIIAGIQKTNPTMPGELKRSLAFDAIKRLAAETGKEISDRYVNQLIEGMVEVVEPESGKEG